MTEAGNLVFRTKTGKRRVQAYTGDTSLIIVLPRSFSKELGMRKIDFLRTHLDENRLILERDVT